ncbi:hypothetical protein C8039_04200 [Halogeometricum sp. wsp3]|nr:hypothetical protein C8039_04200 [Halogeometricum sp. wsp3]
MSRPTTTRSRNPTPGLACALATRPPASPDTPVDPARTHVRCRSASLVRHGCPDAFSLLSRSRPFRESSTSDTTDEALPLSG